MNLICQEMFLHLVDCLQQRPILVFLKILMVILSIKHMWNRLFKTDLFMMVINHLWTIILLPVLTWDLQICIRQHIQEGHFSHLFQEQYLNKCWKGGKYNLLNNLFIEGPSKYHSYLQWSVYSLIKRKICWFHWKLCHNFY